MKEKYPLNFVNFCEYYDKDGKYNCLAFLIGDSKEVVLLEPRTKQCEFVDGINSTKKTLSYMICGDYSLAKNMSIQTSYNFFDMLDSKVETSNTKLNEKLSEVRDNLDCYYYDDIMCRPKHIFISGKKLKQYVSEYVEVKNKMLEEEKQREL